jgi:hypothetical protein
VRRRVRRRSSWEERRQIDRPLFGPNASQGKESNLVPTDHNRRIELMFRLFAPTKGLFEGQDIARRRK